ncbi:MAG TPA: helix-turn-helix domain-containing protein [Actinomycetota bacterium]|nr:helix-turn-helix domain-containing protein [Actinomycetota bacterium]
MRVEELEGRVLRVDEAARVLGIALSTAYSACRRGDLPAFRCGRRWLVPGAALARLLRGELLGPGPTRVRGGGEEGPR